MKKKRQKNVYKTISFYTHMEVMLIRKYEFICYLMTREKDNFSPSDNDDQRNLILLVLNFIIIRCRKSKNQIFYATYGIGYFIIIITTYKIVFGV